MTVPVPGGQQMRFGQIPKLAISPDGRTLVYYTNGLLHVRSLDSFDDVPLAGTVGAVAPFFSVFGVSGGKLTNNFFMYYCAGGKR